MKILKRFLLVAGVLAGPAVFAQSILNDFKGEPLFVVPSAQVNIELSPKVLGVDFPLSVPRTTQFFVRKANGVDTSNTMRMSRSIYMGATLVENSKSTLIWGKGSNLSPSLELGFRRTLDVMSRVRLKSGFYQTFAIAGFLKYQGFREYDKTSQTVVPDMFVHFAPGIRGTYNLHRKDVWVMAFNGSWQHAVSTDKLTGYQQLGSDFYMDGQVASNGKNDGYLGPISPRHQFRLSAAWSFFGIPAYNFPQSRIAGGLNKVQLVVTPYGVVTADRLRNPAYNAGIGLSILPERIFGSENTKFSKSLTLGYNLVKTDNKSNARFLFLAGTFSFGNFKPANKYVSKP